MFRSHDLIPNDAMGRPIHLWRYGSFGAPILVFPSAAGMAHEWDAHGMVEALGDLIDAGAIKLYCVESNVAEAWTRRESDARWRLARHQAYERFVIDALVPFIHEDCRTEDIPISVTGTSLGAFYAANFALKYPEVFRYALCLSGRYDMSEFADGSRSQEFYYNNPMWYVPNLEGDPLERVRRHTRLTIVCGQGRWEDGNAEESRALATHLEAKGIPHLLDLWGRDVDHNWTWWKRQALLHFGKTFGAGTGR